MRSDTDQITGRLRGRLRERHRRQLVARRRRALTWGAAGACFAALSAGLLSVIPQYRTVTVELAYAVPPVPADRPNRVQPAPAVDEAATLAAYRAGAVQEAEARAAAERTPELPPVPRRIRLAAAPPAAGVERRWAVQRLRHATPSSGVERRGSARAMDPGATPEPPPPVLAEPAVLEPHVPAWRRFAAVTGNQLGRGPFITIVLDDLGLNRERTLRGIALPGPLTLSFLPYGSGVDAYARKASEAGHEVLVHIPMEPADMENDDPGPHALMVSMSPAELDRELAWNLTRLSGYVGVNNHMGSRFTAVLPAMNRVMNALRDRGLLFVDSLTTVRSVAEATANQHAVPFLKRDVFLDNDQAPAAIDRQLQLLERLARRNGHAVAIGHPHPATLDRLEVWLPGLSGRGLQLAPVSVIAQQKGRLAS